MAVLERSEAMESLHFEQVVRRVLNDRRTDWTADPSLSLGYPFKIIRDEVIKKGLADFSVGHESEKYGILTADDKTLLYCFANMTLHFFEAMATFRGYKAALAPMFENPGGTLMVDLGCGPGTAGLALVDTFQLQRLRYRGIDQAKPMLRQANVLFQAVKDVSRLTPDSQIVTTSSWNVLRDLASKIEKPVRILMNATYLFASDSLDVVDLSTIVKSLKANEHVQRLVFTYANSGAALAGAKFAQFKNGLKGGYKTAGPVADTVSYRKKRRDLATQTAQFVRELLVFKE